MELNIYLDQYGFARVAGTEYHRLVVITAVMYCPEVL
jgi:hypothetical protein